MEGGFTGNVDIASYQIKFWINSLIYYNDPLRWLNSVSLQPMLFQINMITIL